MLGLEAMTRDRLKDKRFCSNCNSDNTYLDKRGTESWYSREGKWYCAKCYGKLFKVVLTEKWNKINGQKRLKFRGKDLLLKFNPRNGICSKCGAVKGINCKNTVLHHIQYHEDDPLKDTIELCRSCHRKAHKKIKM